jgi:NitT/TauT family transport system ATP-binding protein
LSTASRNEALIVAAGVTKTYVTTSGETVRALGGIDLRIAAGEFVCIVGASGCGKSTFLRLLAGLDSIGGGQLTLSGHALRGPSREVGVVFQNATLLPWLTVIENVRLPLRVGGRQADDRGRVDDLLAMVGLSGFENKYPYELSGGMQQRAAICRALVRDPKVLLLDEPFGALDALTRERMNLELQRIWRASGKTVLLITHSIEESIFLGDRVVVMSPRPGRILADFPVTLARPRGFDITPGEPDYIRLAREIRAVLDRGEAAHAA